MDHSEIEKELRRALKYEEKKAKQREKRRLGPNAGTGAKGYGLFKKDRLFPQPGCSRKLPSEPKPNKVKKKTTNQNQGTKVFKKATLNSLYCISDPENTNYVDCNNEEHGIKTSKEARGKWFIAKFMFPSSTKMFSF